MDKMLSAVELAQMQSDLNAIALPDTCNLLEKSETSDGAGGFTESWGTATGGTAVPCRLDSVSGVTSTAGAELNLFTALKLAVPADTNIDVEMHVLHNGIEYSVVDVDTDSSWPACITATIEEVD